MKNVLLATLAVLMLLPGMMAALAPSLFGLVAVMAGFSFMMTRDGLSLLDRLGKTAVVVARYQPARPLRRI